MADTLGLQYWTDGRPFVAEGDTAETGSKYWIDGQPFLFAETGEQPATTVPDMFLLFARPPS